jgi:hypothetical protein
LPSVLVSVSAIVNKFTNLRFVLDNTAQPFFKFFLVLAEKIDSLQNPLLVLSIQGARGDLGTVVNFHTTREFPLTIDGGSRKPPFFGLVNKGGM